MRLLDKYLTKELVTNMDARTRCNMLSVADNVVYQAVADVGGQRTWLSYRLPLGSTGEPAGVCDINRIWPSEQAQVLGVSVDKCDRWEVAKRSETGCIEQVQISDYQGRVRDILNVTNPRRLFDYGS
jgi:hypothetical protein